MVSGVRTRKMADIVSRRPGAGLAAGIIIGALGWLLAGMDASPDAGRRITGLLFMTTGYIFLFIAAMALLHTFLSVLRKRTSPRKNDGP